MKNGIHIVSFDARTAKVRMQQPLAVASIAAAEGLEARLADIARTSQWGLNNVNKQDNFNYRSAADILPKDEDYITVDFRAISKAVIPGHWIDWTKGNVLKDSVKKLVNQTVYPNHDFFDIEQWLGSVSAASWDEAGEKSEGVPGINATYKIDALMNPRIARGLLMKPPAIHSTSMTVLFKFEYSHPDIAAENRWRFFDLLGEEVDGEVVRLVVTEILEYWEASLVFQGADRLAKQHASDDEEDFAGMSAREHDRTDRTEFTAGDCNYKPAVDPPANSTQEKTMKLTAEQKAKLGIEFDGDEVPETELFKAGESLADRLAKVDQVNIAELTARAEAGDLLVQQKREQVIKLAKLAELGAEEGDLEEVIAEQITKADADTLVKLEGYFQKKAADKFPENRRSSQEESKEIDAAGGVKQEANQLPKVSVL